MPGKLNVRIVFRVILESKMMEWWADLLKFVLNEDFLIEQLLPRLRWCFFDFCTKFFANFLCVKFWNKCCLLLCNVGKSRSDLPVVTEKSLGADTIILIGLLHTFSIVTMTLCLTSKLIAEQYSRVGRIENFHVFFEFWS